MGRLGRRARLARELTELHVAVIELRERLGAEQQSTASLQFRLQELERRNHELAIRISRDEAVLSSAGASGIGPPTTEPRTGRDSAGAPAATTTSVTGAAPTKNGTAGPERAVPPGRGRSGSFPPPPPPPPLSAGGASASIHRLPDVAESASSSSERNEYAIEELRTALQRMNNRLDELTYGMQAQLIELGFEIERAAASTRVCAAVSDLALDRQLETLRTSQVRLAGEQARYEIALRAELAAIADGLRRFS